MWGETEAPTHTLTHWQQVLANWRRLKPLHKHHEAVLPQGFASTQTSPYRECKSEIHCIDGQRAFNIQTEACTKVLKKCHKGKHTHNTWPGAFQSTAHCLVTSLKYHSIRQDLSVAVHGAFKSQTRIAVGMRQGITYIRNECTQWMCESNYSHLKVICLLIPE